MNKLLPGICLLLSMPFLLADTRSFAYRETTDQKEEQQLYQMSSNPDGYEVTIKGLDSALLIHTNINMEVFQCSMVALTATMNARREDKEHLSVELNGTKTILNSQSQPWYQSMVFLKPFILSKEQEKQFFVLNPTAGENTPGGELLYFRAKKNRTEQLVIMGNPIDTIKVDISFDDWRSLFWGSRYWFRASDGLLVAWELPKGAGAPLSKGLLISEQ